MAEMKFSKANLKSVEDRLVEYAHAIEGGTRELGFCKICDTVDIECQKCVLGSDDPRTPFDDVPCWTTTRAKISEYLNEHPMYGKVFNNIPMWLLKKRRKEIENHIIKRLAE